MAVRLVKHNEKLKPAKPDIAEAYLEREKENLLEAKKELERSQLELEQFVYMASHDLEEPLRMVASYTQLLAKRYRGRLDADADDFISYAMDGANRMQKLINNMLAYSRVKTGEKKFKLIDCEAVLVSAIANLQLLTEDSGSVITYDPMPAVKGDDVQLIRVFQNLIGNAIKFCGNKKPEIHISAELKNGEWIFSVRDNGIGIADCDKDGIFNIFQRADNKEKYSGSGIGLAICKKIVENHGGRIWVDSKPKKGSIFYFTMPVWNRRK